MGKRGSRKKTTKAGRQELFDLYPRRRDHIDNGDLVNPSAHLFTLHNRAF